MAATRIGINGFGRMGRLALRAMWGSAGLEPVAVNEPAGDAAASAHLLTFDSVHGRWGHDARGDGDVLRIDGRPLAYSRHGAPGEVPWDELGVDVVLECSGRFRTPELLEPYFARGVRRVVVAAPVKHADALNVVLGVNDHLYDPAIHDIVTAASCTTNCLAPVVKVLHEGLGIMRGSITTLHDVTNTQVLVDAPHKDLRRARAAGLSLIPTTTGSATAIGLIFPDLQGRLDGLAVRVPLLNASLTDAVFEVGRTTDVEEVNGLLAHAAAGPLARHPRLRGAAAGLGRLPRTTPDRGSWTRARRWSPAGPRSRCWPGTTTSGATRTGSSISPPGWRRRPRASSAPRDERRDRRHRRGRGRPAQLRDRHRRLLGRHDRRRRQPHAGALLLLRARLQPVRGRDAVPLLRGLRRRHEPRRRVRRGALRAADDAADGPGDPARRARACSPSCRPPGSSCPT